MTRFTLANTDGYTQDQLDELNRRFETFIANDEASHNLTGIERKSYEDYVAEQLLAKFDVEVLDADQEARS